MATERARWARSAVRVHVGDVAFERLMYVASCSCGWGGTRFVGKAPAEKELRQHRTEVRA